MAGGSGKFTSPLEPIDRISEILFGLIMVLTITTTLSVVTAGRADIQTMVLSALGCNLAWGIIDAGTYLLERLEERGRNLLTLRAVVEGKADEARRALAEALPAKLVSVLSKADLDSMRQKLSRRPQPPARPRLTGQDFLGALSVCLLVFFSTLPVVIPFLLVDDARLGLRLSNAVAIVMLFLCGYAFARCTGLNPWLTGLVMVVIGSLMVAIAIALGG